MSTKLTGERRNLLACYMDLCFAVLANIFIQNRKKVFSVCSKWLTLHLRDGSLTSSVDVEWIFVGKTIYVYVFVELHYNLYNKGSFQELGVENLYQRFKEHETHLTCSFRFPSLHYSAISSQYPKKGYPISSSIQKKSWKKYF